MISRAMPFLLLLGCSILLHAPGTFAADTVRAAVIVGANDAPPGRLPLRFAHNDAQDTARVLRTVGGFDSDEVEVLLDPRPDDVLRALDEALARLAAAGDESMLLFHYSGHADLHGLYPRGEVLAFASLRTRLEDTSARVRIGIIDACRGGAWTGTRGLHRADTFEVPQSLDLSSEGSVLIASSSGLEDAHESESLRGGFFTHHWNAALLGAGDQNEDRRVTLTEAFEYAKRLTIRDSAVQAQSPQRPSYRMQLKGRTDLLLSSLASGSTTLEVRQHTGPLELVELATGRIVAELPKGRRVVKLSLPAGPYLLRSRSRNETRAATLNVPAQTAIIALEDDLRPIAMSQLVSRNAPPPPTTETFPPEGEIRVAVGVRHYGAASGLGLGRTSDLQFFVAVPSLLTERLQWVSPTLSLAYRFGDRGGTEVVPWGGLVGYGFSRSSDEGFVFHGDIALGVDLKRWFGSRSGFVAGAHLASDFSWAPENGRRSAAPESWQAVVTAGFTHTFANIATVHLGLRYSQFLLESGGLATSSESMFPVLGFGSVQSLGLRQLPLVSFHINDDISVDGYAGVHYEVVNDRFLETYLLGTTFRL